MTNNEKLTRRIWAFSVSAVFLIASIVLGVIIKELLICAVVGVLGFFFISCLIFNNNFIGDVVSGIIDWGFVRMPGLIFSLDLDGIIWFLTVKLIFFILQTILSIVVFILAMVIGAALSVFVYPYAVYKNFKKEDPTPEQASVEGEL